MSIVDAQMHDMSEQMAALDDFVTKARSRNGVFNEAHLDSLNSLSMNIHNSYASLDGQLGGFGGRINQFQTDYGEQAAATQASVAPLSDEVGRPLSILGTQIGNRAMTEYVVTGKTPQRITEYRYPTMLPKTEDRASLFARLKNAEDLSVLPFSGGVDAFSPAKRSPPKPSSYYVYNDGETSNEKGKAYHPATSAWSNTLREIDANVAAGNSTTPSNNVSDILLAPPLVPSKMPPSPGGGEESVEPALKRRRTAGESGNRRGRRTLGE